MQTEKRQSQAVFPKGETVWERIYSSSHELRYIVTSKPARDFYFLYELTPAGFKKLGKAVSPADLKAKVEGL